ncbi:MAG: serine/threonine protein kinase [Gemmataceae bacterium]|nr:serine/threonine protein kinase [Gemmataceae bacterium]
MNTTISEPTVGPGPPGVAGPADDALLARYQALAASDSICWGARYRKIHLLGKGGQGVVYLSEQQGTDLFRLPVAIKIFSPELYRDAASYDEDMARVADITSRVALVQHDNLIDLHNFIAHDGIRVLVMEWVDGYDLRKLLTARMLERTRERLSPERWQHVRQVILADGPQQTRLKPGVAIQILRECLAGLAALHRDGIVHGDLKPANIMVKRTGNAKIIDIGSAMDIGKAQRRRMWSPTYAAPEVLAGGEATPHADLASLGYVLVEMLAGQCPFDGIDERRALLEAKLQFEQRLRDILPPEVVANDLLMYICQKLTAANPSKRFASAQAADVGRKGAAAFHRQLVKGDLASEYVNDLRHWLEDLD